MEGDYSNIMKITFDFQFDKYLAFKKHWYTKTLKQREDVNLQTFFLITCNSIKACHQ